MFWQKLPRQLQYPKTVILHRRDGTSWGFSIVGEFNHQTENMYQAPSCWGSVKRNTQCTFLFAHKRILKTLTYILYFSQGISRWAFRNSFFLSIRKGTFVTCYKSNISKITQSQTFPLKYFQNLSLRFSKKKHKRLSLFFLNFPGGAEPGSDRSPEPVHVLFVVPESPAWKDGKLKCGDRWHHHYHYHHDDPRFSSSWFIPTTILKSPTTKSPIQAGSAKK